MTLEALGIHTTASFNSSNPIDSNGSATNASTVGGVDAIISTTASAAFTVGSSRHSVPNPTPGSGFTQVPGTGGEYNLLEYKVVASPQTNMDFTNAGLVEEAVGTAFVESAGSSGQPHSMTLGTGFH